MQNDFFEELVVDFVQYDLFDQYLNYRFSELLLISNSFQKINDIDKYFQRKNGPEGLNKEFLDMIAMIEELLEYESKDKVSIYRTYLTKENKELFEKFCGGMWSEIELVYLLKRVRCPNFCLSFYKIYSVHYRNLLSAGVEVEDMELVQKLSLNYFPFLYFVSDCINKEWLGRTKITTPEKSKDFKRVFEKLVSIDRNFYGKTHSKIISLIEYILCDDQDQFSDLILNYSINIREYIDLIVNCGAKKIFHFLEIKFPRIIKGKICLTKAENNTSIYYDLT